MIIKKPGILLSSCNTFTHLWHSTPPQSRTSLSTLSKYQSRGYATVVENPSDHNKDDGHWPQCKPGHQHPTPYQILGCRRGHAYSKSRFYELVKLYHPDRQTGDGGSLAHTHPSIRHIPHAIRLERYRLIVAAHTILSDPIRRSAYDSWGAGWGGHPEVPSSNDGYGRPASWGMGQSPMHCATWEDWERWYQRNDEKPQEPLYLSNGVFISFVAMLAILGGVGQATRVGNFSTSMLEQRNAAHHLASQELVRARSETIGGTKEDRIANFLRHKDPDSYRDESLRRLLLEPDMCASKNVRSKDVV
ncbi:hypothetical protein H2201_003892 [Coniosporium apollinis]|uniref:J domain-containing protein n=1 Tax=Coniosporium apollinis TaxID=61459 RepID=A0ABQ9NWB7_9PEZI|nr:hypothetical protein H2201_003892 [Coniosporium apollinis]